MPSVYPRADSARAAFLLRAFVRASTLHIGAAAAAASLQADLVKRGQVTSEDFQESFAVARLTPGTTLLALEGLLGYRVAAWRGLATGLAVGTLLPAAIAILIAILYVDRAAIWWVAALMEGAQAGAVAAFVWAVIKLIAPPVQHQRGRRTVLALAVLAASLLEVLPQFWLLLICGAVGALMFREDR